MFEPRGIAGVEGRRPIGAAVTIGRKGDRGFPVDKDYFHVMEPHEAPGGRRRPHPLFGWWNDRPAGQPSDAWKAQRRTIRGILAHEAWDACLTQHLQAYRPDKVRWPGGGPPMPPDGQPWCKGDGEQARRYIGEKGDDDWRTITCPHRACCHRSPTGRNKITDCKPLTRFLFRMSYSDAVVAKYTPPTPVVMFQSGGWKTYRAILGLREDLDAAARTLGLESYSPAGLSFTLTLTEGTSKKGGGRRYPYVNVSPDESAIDFLVRAAGMRQHLRAIAEGAPSMPVFGPSDGRLLTGAPTGGSND